MADPADEPCHVPPMQAAGYVLRIREREWFQHRLFSGPDTCINLHVVSSGAAKAERVLRFRNRLRDDDPARDRYVGTNRELAQRTSRHVQDHADAETAVVNKVLDAAQAHRPKPEADTIGE